MMENVYRIDHFEESPLNPITGKPYDERWAVFMLTDRREYQQFVGSLNGCAYTVKFSKYAKEDWRLALCDFVEYGRANGKQIILVATENEWREAREQYAGMGFKKHPCGPENPGIWYTAQPLRHTRTFDRMEC